MSKYKVKIVINYEGEYIVEAEDEEMAIDSVIEDVLRDCEIEVEDVEKLASFDTSKLRKCGDELSIDMLDGNCANIKLTVDIPEGKYSPEQYDGCIAEISYRNYIFKLVSTIISDRRLYRIVCDEHLLYVGGICESEDVYNAIEEFLETADNEIDEYEALEEFLETVDNEPDEYEKEQEE